MVATVEAPQPWSPGQWAALSRALSPFGSRALAISWGRRGRLERISGIALSDLRRGEVWDDVGAAGFGVDQGARSPRQWGEDCGLRIADLWCRLHRLTSALPFGSWALSVSGVAPAWPASPRTGDCSRKPTWIQSWWESHGQDAATRFDEKPFGRTALDPGAVVYVVGGRVWDALFIGAVATTLVLSGLVLPSFRPSSSSRCLDFRLAALDVVVANLTEVYRDGVRCGACCAFGGSARLVPT